MLVGHKEHEDPQSSGFPLVLFVSFVAYTSVFSVVRISVLSAAERAYDGCDHVV